MTEQTIGRYKDTSLSVEERVEALLSEMTLAEKIGQMTQPEKNSIPPDDVTQYAIGSVLSGGGGNPRPNNKKSWAEMVKAFADAALKTRLGIPLIYGSDAVHGHNNMKDATVFPHNIGLGATHNPDLVEKVARVTAREMLATNVHWDFAPAVSVPQDIRWGRTFEGFSSDPALVGQLGAAFVRGLQQPDDNSPISGEHRALASVKHFVGDGGTDWGSRIRNEWIHFVWNSDGERWMIDQGACTVDEPTLRDIHLAPYLDAIEAGAVNIMVSYNTWDSIKLHGHKYLLTDVLKGELGFDGFLVSDWMAINQLDEDYYTCVVTSINAGLDMIMVPYDYKGFIAALQKAVEQGDVTESRIDDAVRRILRAKFLLGLFEQPFGDPALLDEVRSPAHLAVARQAVQESLVLLKNENNALPLTKDAPQVFVAGRSAHDIGIQCGGWTVEWMGGAGATTAGTTILEGIKQTVSDKTDVVYNPYGEYPRGMKAPIGIAVIGELPYAEGDGDRASLALSAEDVAIVKRLRSYCERLIVVIVSGRPMIVSEILDDADALVAAWLPGSEGQGVADVLFGDAPFKGKLPHNWPRDMSQVPVSALEASADRPLWPLGYSLTV